jgi:hypothetical protein
MGYELSIKIIGSKIPRAKWISYVQDDEEFELIQEFSSELTSGEEFIAKTLNIGLWKNDVPFIFMEDEGEIHVKNPDLSVIEKMILVAKSMNAIVIGEEEEIYDDAYIKKEKNAKPINLDDYKHLKIRLYNPNKKWWQFWKKGIHL